MTNWFEEPFPPVPPWWQQWWLQMMQLFQQAYYTLPGRQEWYQFNNNNIESGIGDASGGGGRKRKTRKPKAESGDVPSPTGHPKHKTQQLHDGSGKSAPKSVPPPEAAPTSPTPSTGTGDPFDHTAQQPKIGDNVLDPNWKPPGASAKNPIVPTAPDKAPASGENYKLPGLGVGKGTVNDPTPPAAPSNLPSAGPSNLPSVGPGGLLPKTGHDATPKGSGTGGSTPDQITQGIENALKKAGLWKQRVGQSGGPAPDKAGSPIEHPVSHPGTSIPFKNAVANRGHATYHPPTPATSTAAPERNTRPQHATAKATAGTQHASSSGSKAGQPAKKTTAKKKVAKKTKK